MVGLMVRVWEEKSDLLWALRMVPRLERGWVVEWDILTERQFVLSTVVVTAMKWVESSAQA